MIVLKAALITIILVCIFDAIWLTLNIKNYNSLVLGVQGSIMKVNITGAIVAYFFMFLSFLLIVYPSIKLDIKTTDLMILALKHGAALGFVIYGIYNATNYAIFKNYNLKVAICDTLWGTFLYFMTVLITLYIIKLIK